MRGMRYSVSVILLVLVAAAAAGCRSQKKATYERIAREANPLLTAMKPAAVRILAAQPDDRRAAVLSCMGVEEVLWKLRDVKLDDEFIDDPHSFGTPTTSVEFLLDERSRFCGKLTSPDMDLSCSRWCRGHWEVLIASVEEMRKRAKAQGVDIVSLKP
jgi:hypothetical protein